MSLFQLVQGFHLWIIGLILKRWYKILNFKRSTKEKFQTMDKILGWFSNYFSKYGKLRMYSVNVGKKFERI